MFLAKRVFKYFWGIFWKKERKRLFLIEKTWFAPKRIQRIWCNFFYLYTYINISKFPKALWSRSIMVRSRIFLSCTIFSHFRVKYSILECPHYIKMLKYLSVCPKLWFLLKHVISSTRDVADRAIRIDADRLSSILGWSAHVENYIFYVDRKMFSKMMHFFTFYTYLQKMQKCDPRKKTLYIRSLYIV